MKINELSNLVYDTTYHLSGTPRKFDLLPRAVTAKLNELSNLSSIIVSISMKLPTLCLELREFVLLPHAYVKCPVIGVDVRIALPLPVPSLIYCSFGRFHIQWPAVCSVQCTVCSV